MSFGATLVDDKNRDAFVGPLSEESRRTCDVIIGLYEEESDTACGVLAAISVPDGGKDTVALLVMDMIIEDSFMCPEAESTLLTYLQEIAGLYECGAIFMSQYIPEEDKEREDFYEDLGFFEEDNNLTLYEIDIGDITPRKNNSDMACLSLPDLSDKQWKDFVLEASAYSFEMLDKDYYDPKTSIFLMDDDGNIQAGMLTSIRDGELFIEGMAPFGGDEEALIDELVFWGNETIKKYYTGDKSVFIFMVSNKTYNRILKEVTNENARKKGSLVSFTYELPVV
jgi:hypothetical protein